MNYVIVNKRSGHYLKALLPQGREYGEDWASFEEAHQFNSCQEAADVCRKLKGVEILPYNSAAEIEKKFRGAA